MKTNHSIQQILKMQWTLEAPFLRFIAKCTCFPMERWNYHIRAHLPSTQHKSHEKTTIQIFTFLKFNSTHKVVSMTRTNLVQVIWDEPTTNLQGVECSFCWMDENYVFICTNPPSLPLSNVEQFSCKSIVDVVQLLKRD